MTSGSWFDNFGQISFGVPDLDSATRFWRDQLGIGPWSLFYGLTFSAQHEGRSVSFPFNVAIAWHDGRIVELMNVTGDGPSPLHDTLNRPIIGLQRLASLTNDIERDSRAAEERGMERFAEGEAAGQRFVYYRSSAAPGVILELLERTEGFDGLCKQLEERAAATRDMKKPIISPSAPQTGIAAATMRAAMLGGYGGIDQFTIETVPTPDPGEGQVRIKVAATAVNPVDAKMRRGELRDWLPLRFPARLGGDVAGIVDAVGVGVTRFMLGDRVVGLVPPNLDGASAQWVVAPEGTLVHVPSEMELADAAALPTGVLTGIQLTEIGVRPKAGDKILVTGAGGSVGRAAVIAALDAGARVYAGVRASSLDAIADLSVSGVIDLGDSTAIAAAGPFDAVADTVGGRLAEQLFAYVRPDGIVASIAMPPPVQPVNATQRFCSLIVRFDGPRLEKFMRSILSTGRTMPIAHRLALADVGRAHQLIETGGVGGKIIIEP